MANMSALAVMVLRVNSLILHFGIGCLRAILEEFKKAAAKKRKRRKKLTLSATPFTAI
jgi:hypothetical protein